MASAYRVLSPCSSYYDLTLPSWYFKILRRSGLARGLVRWAKDTRWPGFENLSLYDTVIFLVNESLLNDIAFRSYAIAYTFFISLFPAILVLFTLIPYLPIYDRVDETLVVYLYDLLPGDAADYAYEFIQDIGTRERSGLLSLSFVLAIYFSSNGIMAMMRSFEKPYEYTYRERTVVKKRVVAIGLTFSFGLLLVASVVLITLGTAGLDFAQSYYDLGVGYGLLLRSLQWTAIAALLYSAIALTYRYGTATLQRFNFFSPGATLATALSILTSLGFAVYLDNFDSYNKLYGSIGTIIVFMLWLQLNVLWILIGYELNAGIAINRDLKRAREDREAD